MQQHPYNAPYQAPQGGGVRYGGPSTHFLAVLSLLFGGLSATVGWLCCHSAAILGPLSMICGLIALLQIRSAPNRYSGFGIAMTGLILGALGLCLWIGFIVLGVAVHLSDLGSGGPWFGDLLRRFD